MIFKTTLMNLNYGFKNQYDQRIATGSNSRPTPKYQPTIEHLLQYLIELDHVVAFFPLMHKPPKEYKKHNKNSLVW